MSGFDAGWLALREPVDHASRHTGLAAHVRDHFAEHSSLAVVDLGCGTGSNLRALAPSLPLRQRWHLIDGDIDLLAVARQCLADWADSANATPTGIELRKDAHRINVSFECADLMIRDLYFADIGAELVTAAALFDLVSKDWLERLVAGAARRRIPLYSVLNYDGIARWRPSVPLDARVIAAFNRHQRGDKGFGPALGPMAGAAFAESLSQHGYAVDSADSPWELAEQDAELIARLADGFAQAATEIEPEGRDVFAEWALMRTEAAQVTIGHRDIFATM
ncbi:class I SAM-dependent methyltransferase [Ancylobacter sp. VNQ12]|uniref:class I SAM-dependent methyltransferase n=1 Tax=Ancylobacter sp. VNQ12 TaxID=3400920 RepID=UPI003C123FB7